MARLAPVLTVLAVIVALWYAAAVWMNRAWVIDQAERDGISLGLTQVIPATLNQEQITQRIAMIDEMLKYPAVSSNPLAVGELQRARDSLKGRRPLMQ